MTQNIAVGYSALINQFNLSVIAHFRESYIAPSGRSYVHIEDNREIHVYQKTYALKNPDDSFEQLEFAIKHDGINLEILQAVFNEIPRPKIEQYITTNHTNKLTRIIWFLYEFINQVELKIPELKQLKYIDVLDKNMYFTSNGIKSQRHKVINNLLGTKDFCPIVRKTKKLDKHLSNTYDQQAINIANKYDTKVIARASHYFFTKETLSSYEIEREKPSTQRITRFIEILKQIPKISSINKEKLVEIQNVIVDPRFKDSDYRKNQNYVGEVVYYSQIIHYISPKPEDVNALMEGLLNILESENNLNPVIFAAIVAFGFVFIHPFEDGNGRIHRLLIHYILSKYKFTPHGVIFPISAVMLNKMHNYDSVLESFSKPIMQCIDHYNLSDDGVLTVGQDTKSYYQFIDYTHFAEYLFDCIQETLEEHFELEIEYLMKYDRAKVKIQTVVDMPDKLIDIFIKFAMQNNGKIGNKKRNSYFDKLTDKEIDRLEEIIQLEFL